MIITESYIYVVSFHTNKLYKHELCYNVFKIKLPSFIFQIVCNVYFVYLFWLRMSLNKEVQTAFS